MSEQNACVHLLNVAINASSACRNLVIFGLPDPVPLSKDPDLDPTCAGNTRFNSTM